MISETPSLLAGSTLFFFFYLLLQLAVNLVDVNIHGDCGCYFVKHPHCTDEYNLHTSQASCTP